MTGVIKLHFFLFLLFRSFRKLLFSLEIKVKCGSGLNTKSGNSRFEGGRGSTNKIYIPATLKSRMFYEYLIDKTYLPKLASISYFFLAKYAVGSLIHLYYLCIFPFFLKKRNSYLF